MQDDPQELIGFIGMGTMGARMAMRLLDAGFELLVWNRTPERCDAVVARGADAADSLAELVEACDIVLLCLSDTEVVEEVVFGPEGVASTAEEGQILVDLSGIDPAATRRFAQELRQQTGAGWVDAPVSGGPAAAAAGTLAIMAGGDEDDVERVRPVLECLGRNVTHMGEIGSGQLARACHQLLVGGGTLLLAEMIALAERAGLDAELLPQAFAGGLADSPLLRVLVPRMAVREYEPVMAQLGNLEKDMENVLGVAREADASLPLGALAAQLLRQHRARAGSDADSTSIIELYSAE
jgi:3-hydroxyisobutyrate dehydrogenase